MLKRRDFLRASVGTGLTLAATGLLPSWARSASQGNLGLREVTGSRFDLTIDRFPIRIDGRQGHALGVNRTLPAPLLRFREGDDIVINVVNRLDEDTSIHWHGLLVPFYMDGVPGVSFPGIRSRESFSYRFSVPQNGTYWYHSHSGLQEQVGMFGPLVIDPRDVDPVAYDREYVLVLSDWTFENPHTIFRKLKAMSESFNFARRTVTSLLEQADESGMEATLEDHAMWTGMRMSPRDIADVTGATYTYLINGHSTLDNWNGVFKVGERVRLRIINASAMTIFNVRIPGLPMSVVQSDGLNIQPLAVDEFQIGVAETYDVVIQPEEEQAYAIVAESIDRSGQAVATLGPRPGMRADPPPMRETPNLTMKDMGMDHAAHGEMDHSAHGEMDHSAHRQMDHSAHGEMDHAAHGEMDHAAHGEMDHSAHGEMDHAAHGEMDHTAHGEMDHAAHGEMANMQRMLDGSGASPVKRSPGVANIAEMPSNRLDEPGTGLENVPHRVMRYSQLRSLEPNPDTRQPGREIVVHLTGNMERYMWSFNGVKFSEITEPIVLHEGERVRLTMVNNTMMNHPIHLHGMFFDLVNGGENHRPRKHTVIVKPGERLSVDVSADHVGDWAFHCHLLFHMHAGMMQVVSVMPRGDADLT